jgi:hypothetical protein
VNELLSKAVAKFRSSPRSGDAEIHRMLVAEGFEPAIAGRLVEFLPMVYCRLMLEGSGVRFSKTYQRRFADGKISPEKLLSSEPVWKSARAFAQNELDRGVSTKDLMAVAMRSSEFDTINQLSSGGSDLKNVVLTPALLTWPEDGPK